MKARMRRDWADAERRRAESGKAHLGVTTRQGGGVLATLASVVPITVTRSAIAALTGILRSHDQERRRLALQAMAQDMAASEAERNKARDAIEKLGEGAETDAKGWTICVAIDELGHSGATPHIDMRPTDEIANDLWHHFKVESLDFAVNLKHLTLLRGLKIDYVQRLKGEGFELTHPEVRRQARGLIRERNGQ